MRWIWLALVPLLLAAHPTDEAQGPPGGVRVILVCFPIECDSDIYEVGAHAQDEARFFTMAEELGDSCFELGQHSQDYVEERLQRALGEADRALARGEPDVAESWLDIVRQEVAEYAGPLDAGLVAGAAVRKAEVFVEKGDLHSAEDLLVGALATSYHEELDMEGRSPTLRGLLVSALRTLSRRELCEYRLSSPVPQLRTFFNGLDRGLLSQEHARPTTVRAFIGRHRLSAVGPTGVDRVTQHTSAADRCPVDVRLEPPSLDLDIFVPRQLMQAFDLISPPPLHKGAAHCIRKALPRVRTVRFLMVARGERAAAEDDQRIMIQEGIWPDGCLEPDQSWKTKAGEPRSLCSKYYDVASGRFHRGRPYP